MSERIYLIYKHTSPSGKSYIGLTKDYDRRCREHQTRIDSPAFHFAILKYGWDNFTHDILVERLTIEEANIHEMLYITEHQSLSPSGYNLTAGGGSGIVSEETKTKMSRSNKGKKLSDVTKAKISAKLKGQQRSIETLAKIRAIKHKISYEEALEYELNNQLTRVND